MEKKQTVLFCPFNGPGHINSILGIADKLKDDYKVETIFLVLGQPINNYIQSHGHELVVIEDSSVYEDYEIEECDSLMGPVTEEEVEKRQCKEKKKFPGASKWPQILARCQKAFSLDPVEAYVRTVNLFEAGFEQIKENNDKYEKMINKIQPDMVVVDLYDTFPAVAKLKNIPWVKVFSPNPLTLLRSKLPNKIRPPHWTGFELWTKEERERLRKEEPEKWQEILNNWQEAYERVSKALEKVVAAQKQFLAQLHLAEPEPEPQRPILDSPYLNLYMYPKALDYDKDDDIFEYEKHWFRFDSLIRKPLDGLDSELHRIWEDKIDRAMRGKKELVYFSLGSMASGNVDLMNRILNMLKIDEQRCYVVSKGINGHKIRLNPSNMIGEDYVPQTFILQRCNLAIIHGGNNSITECLYYGVPIIVLPVFFDQFDNAQRVADLCLGKKLLPYSCSTADLMDAINGTLANKTLKSKCKEISREIKTRDDSRKVSAMLKKLMDDGRLEESFIEECRERECEEIKF